jgi:hypothetical protein
MATKRSYNLGRLRVHLALFLVLLVAYVYVLPRWADWNQNSRFNLVLALVEDRSVMIDPYVANTGDYAYYRGHYYSDKAPGLSLLGATVYGAYRVLVPSWLTERWQAVAARSQALGATLRSDGAGLRLDSVSYFAGLTVTTALTVAVPSALLGVLVFMVTGLAIARVGTRVVIALLYGLATGAAPYANTFVGHQLAACLLFAAFVLLYVIWRRAWARGWLIVVGLLIGYAIITEYPAGLIGGLLTGYAVLRLGRPWQTLGLLAVGALPPLALLAAYDLVAFGTLLPVGYLYSSLWTDVHSTGLVSLTLPQAEALWGITFGAHRGLFFLSPFLLFAAPGYWVLWQRRDLRPEWWVLALAPLLFLLFNGSSAMWQGGFGIGPRYLLPALPFLATVAGVGLASSWTHRIARPLVLAACGWSVFAVWTQTLGGQAFPDYTPNPLFDLSLPRLLAGEVARNVGMVFGLSGWTSLLPMLVLALALALIVHNAEWLARHGSTVEPTEVERHWTTQ